MPRLVFRNTELGQCLRRLARWHGLKQEAGIFTLVRFGTGDSALPCPAPAGASRGEGERCARVSSTMVTRICLALATFAHVWAPTSLAKRWLRFARTRRTRRPRSIHHLVR